MPQQDATSLDNFADIVSADPISWWPPAIGWWFVLALIALWSSVYLVQWIKRWFKNRYRREALRLLQQIESASETPQLTTLVKLDALLKRVALAAYPRELVASLTGPEWLYFLETTGNDHAFQKEPVALLATAAAEVEPSQLSDQQFQLIVTTCEKWIRSHSAEAPTC